MFTKILRKIKLTVYFGCHYKKITQETHRVGFLYSVKKVNVHIKKYRFEKKKEFSLLVNSCFYIWIN